VTPSQYVKSQGLPSLAYVARESATPIRTLFDWYHKRFKLFEVVVAGVYHVDVCKVKEDIDANRVVLVGKEQFKIMTDHEEKGDK